MKTIDTPESLMFDALTCEFERSHLFPVSERFQRGEATNNEVLRIAVEFSALFHCMKKAQVRYEGR